MSIASRIEAIEGHITNDYQALSDIGADLTGVDKNIENIANVLADIYDEMPKVTDTGDNITLENTRKGAMSITYKGETQQDSTTQGKNLFDGELELGTYTDNGAKYNSNANYRNKNIIKVQPNTTYTFSINGVSQKYALYYYNSSKTFISSLGATGGTFTTPSNCYYLNFRCFNADFTNDYSSLKVQCELGSSATSWEPFIPNSPSPDYPQPIHNVSGDNTIEICGKNLANYTKWEQGNFYVSGSSINNNVASENVIRMIDFMNVLPNTTYTLSCNIAIGQFGYVYKDTSDNLTGGYWDLSNSFVSFTTPANVNKVRLRIGNSSYKKTYGTDYNIQLEKNNQASTYEPYTSQTQLISLGVENLLPKPSSSSSSSGAGNITLTWNTNNEYKISGSATSSGNLNAGDLANDYTIKNKDYLHLCNNDIPSGTIQIVGISSSSTQIFAKTINSKYQIIDLSSYAGSILRFLRFYCVSGASVDMTVTPMILNEISRKTTYSEYGKPYIELNKISTYQDYIYKENDRWYLHKEIGKVVLDGVTNKFLYKHSSITSETKGFYDFELPNKDKSHSSGTNNLSLSDYFRFVNGTAQGVFNDNLSAMWWEGSTNYCWCVLEETSLANANAWLTTHNTSVYYVLATPTDTEITDTELLTQLQTILKSKSGQTNINQENNDLPFILDVSALKEWNNE